MTSDSVRKENNMSRRKQNDIRSSNVHPGLALVCAALLPAAAVGGDWKLSDSFSSKLTAVDHSGNDSSSGTVLSVSPSVTLTGKGGRVSGDLDYGINLTQGSGNTDPTRISHNLTARGDVEAVKNLLNIGVDALARLVPRSSSAGSVDSISRRSDTRQSFSLAVSPVLRARLGRQAEFVSSNSIDYVTNGGGDEDESVRWRVNVGLVNGSGFGPFTWNVGATHTETDYRDRSNESTDAQLRLGYRINPQWQVSASSGWEDNKKDTDRNDTDGFIWDVGTEWTPNPRTSLNANYGERYFGSSFSGKLTHRTRKTTLTLDVSRAITSRRNFRLLDNQVSVLDRANGRTDFLDLNPSLDEDEEEFVNTAIRGVIKVSGLRTTFTLSGDVSNREYEVSGRDQESYGLGVRVGRNLGHDLSATLGASYDYSEESAGDSSDSYDLFFSLTHTLSAKSSVSLDLDHRNRDSNNSSDENRIGVTFKTSFL